MTIPSLINNYQEKELVTRTKKAYSVIQNAILLAQVENNSVGDNTFLFDTTKTSAEVAENFSKYFNGAVVCKDKNSAGCNDVFYTVKFASKSGGRYLKEPKIILPDNTVISVIQFPNCHRTTDDCKQDADGECIKDSSGNTIPTVATHNNCATLYFDVNGTKLPNQYGRDAYTLKITTNDLFPSTWPPEGARSFKNILSGIDKLEYKNF